MGDVDDPEIYAAMPIHDWEQTEQGQWVMEHCADPRFHFATDAQSWGHRVVISGVLEDKDATFWQLKWGHSVKT